MSGVRVEQELGQ